MSHPDNLDTEALAQRWGLTPDHLKHARAEAIKGGTVGKTHPRFFRPTARKVLYRLAEIERYERQRENRK